MTKLMTVKQFCSAHPAFTEGGLRFLIFRAKPTHTSRGVEPGNGFNPALRRIGRRVLIDEERFFRVIDQMNATKGDRQ